MCSALRSNQAVAPLLWVRDNCHPLGGIRAWEGHSEPYPEVTGYLIPTLLKYGEDDLARSFADWLLEVQNADGSFNGLDGIPRAFDTGACYEGLRAAHLHYQKKNYVVASGKAYQWLMSLKDGRHFREHAETIQSPRYNYRINGITYIQTPPPPTLAPDRAHYILYALEGMLELGSEDWVRIALADMWRFVNDRGWLAFDIPEFGAADLSTVDGCATAQMAYLVTKTGGDASRLFLGLEKLQAPSGGLRIGPNANLISSWAAKFYLDALFERYF